MILASSSKQRIDILKELYPDIKIKKHQFNEELLSSIKKPIKYITKCVIEKGLSIDSSSDYVIAADTIIFFNNQIIRKPINKEEAYSLIERLIGNYHYVYSGYAIFKNNELLIKRISKTKIFIHKMSKEKINEYIETNKPLNKAGAYGIQDTEYIKCDIISGNYYTVLGLDKDKLKKDIALFINN